MKDFGSIRRIVGACVPTLCLVFTAAPALADEPAPPPSVAPAPVDPSAQEAELRALREQGKLEEARERNRQDAERRHERRELERAKYEADVARYHRMRDAYTEPTGADARERGTRDALLDRRVFVPNLVGVSFGTVGGFAAVGSGIVSVSAASGDRTGLQFSFSPNADVRVGDHLTLGASFTFLRSDWGNEGAGSTSVAVGFHPRIGLQIPAGPFVVWPRVGPTVGASDTGTGAASLGMAAEVGVVLPLTSRVYLQVAPTLTYSHVWMSGESADMVGVAVRSSLGLAF